MSDPLYNHTSSYNITNEVGEAQRGYMYLEHDDDDSGRVYYFSKTPIYMSSADIEKYEVMDIKGYYFDKENTNDTTQDGVSTPKVYSINGSESQYIYIDLPLTDVIEESNNEDKRMHLFVDDLAVVEDPNTVEDTKSQLKLNFIEKYKFIDDNKVSREDYIYVGTIYKHGKWYYLFKYIGVKDDNITKNMKYVEIEMTTAPYKIYLSGNKNLLLSDNNGMINQNTNKPIMPKPIIKQKPIYNPSQGMTPMGLGMMGGKYDGRRCKSKTKQNKTKQNKTKQNKTKQNKNKNKTKQKQKQNKTKQKRRR